MKQEFVTVLARSGEGDFDHYRIPAVAVTKAGTVIAAYESRRGPFGDWAEIWITLRRSLDGGKSFGEPFYPHRLVEQFHGEKAITWNNPVLIARDSRLHLIFHQEYARVWYCFSDDEGESFSVPEEITETFRQFPKQWNVCASGPGHGIAASDGKLVVPVWMAQGEVRLDIDPTGRIRRHHPSSAGCIYSEDGGKTWRPGFVTSGIENANETAVVQLNDGRYLFNFRNARYEKRRVMGIADTDLTGLLTVWSEMTLPDPACCAGMVRYGGNIYFVNCADMKARIHLTLYESGDEGRTWNRVLLVDEIAGYADIAADESGLSIFYEGEEEEARVLMMKKYRW